MASLSDLETLDRERQTAGQGAQENREEGVASARRPSSQNRFHNFKERDYDFEKLQKQLINQ